jgi:hypothetical protein
VRVSTHELRTALETVFQRPIKNVRRIPSPYSSSFTIEELEVTLDNGTTISTIFKDLSMSAMLEDARRAKPEFLYAPEREIQVYRNVLPSLNLGTAQLYGTIVEPVAQRYWLFLEKLSGQELYELGEFEVWLKAAHWLAKFHTAADPGIAQTIAPALLRYDGAYYARWLQRAHESAGPILDRVASRYDRVIEVLLDLPRTLLHGEFYASNILIQQQGSGCRVCPVDWEMAAIGPALLDVAALASGKWSRGERLRLLEAHHSTLPPRLQSKDFVTAFDCCQLHVALQWVGWSQSWSPPEKHANDWLTEAIRISSEESLVALLG